MNCDNARVSESAINAGAVMGDVGNFSGTISGNNIGGSHNTINKGQEYSESK